MKTLSSPASIASTRAWGAPVFLLQIDLAQPAALTLRFSDQYQVALGEQWLPGVHDWGTFSAALNRLDAGGRPTTGIIDLANIPMADHAFKRPSDLIRSSGNPTGYEWIGAKATLTTLLDASHGSGDAIVETFYLEEPEFLEGGLLRLTMSDLSQLLDQGPAITTISRALFPLCARALEGEEIRRPFGMLRNVPCLPVIDGAVSELAGDVDEAATTLALEDASEFPASGVALVDEELVTWAGKNGNELLNVVRATNDTAAADHATGAVIRHCRTDHYVFVVGEGGPVVRSFADLVTNGTFTSNLAGWTELETGGGAVTWDAGNGGQMKIDRTTGNATGRQNPTVTANQGHRFTFTVRTADALMAVGSSVGVGDIIGSTQLAPGTYVYLVASPTTTLSLQFSAPVGGITFIDDVKLEVLPADFPISAIRNVRVRGVLLTTPPTLEAIDVTLSSGKSFAAITFPVSDVHDFHIGPVGTPPSSQNSTSPASAHIHTVTLPALPPTMVSPDGYRITVTVRATRSGGTAGTAYAQYTDESIPPSGGPWVLLGDVLDDGTDATFTFEVPTYTTSQRIRIGWSGIGAGSMTTVVRDPFIVEPVSGPGGGASTAQAIFGEVTCDVDGLADAAGLVTGTPNLVMTNPGHVSRYIHRYLLPGVTDAMIGSSFAATVTKLANAGYRWDFLLGQTTYTDLRRKLGEQSRSLLFITGGKIEHRFLLGDPSADVTLDYLTDVSLSRPARVSRTPFSEIRNRLTVYSGRDYRRSGLESYARATLHEDLDQGAPRQAGATKDDAVADTLELDFVQDANTARDLGEFRLGWVKQQRFEVEVGGGRHTIALEQADTIALTSHPELAAHGAPVFLVTERDVEPGRGAIGHRAIEARIDAKVGREEADMAYGSRGLRGKNNAGTPTTQFDIAADVAILRNASNEIVVRHNPGSLTCNIATAGPAANGRDQAGAFSANSWLHLYWIWDSTALTLATIASAVAPPTGPTLPTGYTHWAYVGAVRLDGSTQIVRSLITGSLVTRVAVDLVDAPVTVNTEQSVDASAAYPPNALTLLGTWAVVMGAASDTAALRPISGVSDLGLVLEGTAADSFGGGFEMPVDGQTLYYIQSANASREWRLKCNGYRVPNGGL